MSDQESQAPGGSVTFPAPSRRSGGCAVGHNYESYYDLPYAAQVDEVRGGSSTGGVGVKMVFLNASG